MNTVLWFYSGIISGWWCYANETNNMLNNMYINYCKKYGIDYTDFVNIDVKTNCQVTDEFVDFADFVKTDNQNKLMKNIIKTSQDEYIIDFNKMIQQNVNDINKKRNIMYLVIPQNIYKNKNMLKKYLLEKNVKGIAGQKF